MKKFLSILLSVILVMMTVPFYASAAKTPFSTSVGIEKLRKQFVSGVAPKTNGYTLDYE